MNTSVLIFAVTVSLLCFLFLILSSLVIVTRRKAKVAYMTNKDKAFIAKFRAHANFSEYVPLTLILMAIAIYLEINTLIFALLCITFVLGRYIHAYGIIKKERKHLFKFRMFGMTCTLCVMLILALYNFIDAIILFFD